MMAGVTHSLRDVQADLLKIISQDTILARPAPGTRAPGVLRRTCVGTPAPVLG